MSILSGLRSGVRSGLRSGLNPSDGGAPADPMAGVTRDATSLKYAPASAAEWLTTFAADSISASVTSVWPMQEASGALVDVVAGVNLTQSGAGHLYQQPVAAWSRLAVQCTDGTVGQKWINSTTAPNPSTTDVLLLAYVFMPVASPAVARDLMGHAAAADCRFNTTGKLRVVFGASADLTQDPRGRGMPIVLKIDNTNTISALYTDQEKFIGTYTLPANAALVFFGGQTTAASGTAYLYAASFTGASARLSDAQIKLVLQRLGWTIPWS